jgi:hypothetical protein
MPAPAAAVDQQVVWKNDEMCAFAVALVRHALARLYDGRSCQDFTTDIVPDAARGAGHGVAGSVVEMLKNAGVIEPVGITQFGVWYPKREISKRPNCKSRYLCVYRLCSRAVAEEFLRRNKIEFHEVQPELITT